MPYDARTLKKKKKKSSNVHLGGVSRSLMDSDS